MQEASNSKQLIAENIKKSANILVTVSSNPSVDALTAALGLTLMLNKLDKHATAVFSGVIPPAINFLEPTKTFENNIDSLRDFIIALDKDKADRLRYKVEDDVVRIFITPYRTKISQSDLQFSQGDFNVDLIIALGVEDQKDLDQAITAHGRILHDATVVTINAAAQKSSLGSIDWHDQHASSLSEMLASMADSLKAGILDQQISTALLTGIVASTERFSNQLTTPHVMTMSAQLMAAGANQQLIATKLQTIPAPVSPRREKPKTNQSEAGKKVTATSGDDGEMHINHDETSKQQPAPLPMEPVVEPQAAPELSMDLPIAPPPAQSFNDLKQAIAQDTIQVAPRQEIDNEPPTPGSQNINAAGMTEEPSKGEEEGYLTAQPSWQEREIKPPTMGGTLSATAEQALQDKVRQEAEEKRNHTILTHGANGQQPQPTGQQPSSRKRNKKKPGGGQGSQNQQGQQNQPRQAQQSQQPQAPAAQTPASAPAPAPLAPTPESQPMPVSGLAVSQPSTPDEASAPMPEPAAPVEPAPAPVLSPEDKPAEIPVAPPPLVVSEPLSPPPAEQPAPAPSSEVPTLEQASMPPAQAVSAPQEPTLEELEREAANHAVQAAAPQTLSDLEAEVRKHAAQAAPPQAAEVPAPTELSATPMPQPIETPAPVAPAPPLVSSDLPPLPPMPDFGTLPPVPGASELPQLPQQPLQQPPVPQPPLPPQPSQPQATASAPTVPTDPTQFRIPGQ